MSGRLRLRTLKKKNLKKDDEEVSVQGSLSKSENEEDLENQPTDGDRKWGGSKNRLLSVRNKIRKNERRVAENEPELNIIGEIDGGWGFGSGVCCRWQVEYGPTWDCLGGYLEGQTHVDYPSDGNSTVWSHPLDLHFVSKGMQGWPRILFQVWKMDEFGRIEIAGYGFAHLPSSPGSHEIDVATWRPLGTLKEEISAQFLGGTPQLRDIDLLFSKAWSDRCRLLTASSGTIKLRLDVIMKNFHLHSVDI